MKDEIAVFWFRRDLRLQDNAGLYHALKENTEVMPLFIFDTAILKTLEQKKDRRVDFIHQALQSVRDELHKRGSEIRVMYGDCLSVFKKLVSENKIKNVYTNHDYEPSAIKRDEQIKSYLVSEGIEFKTFKDQVIFETDEVIKDDGKPYTVFTPYCRKWKTSLAPGTLESYKSDDYLKNLYKQTTRSFPSLNKIGFIKTDIEFKKPAINDEVIKHYKQNRDFPAFQGTSKLSVHLRFGTLSIREIARHAMQHNETFLNELIWRDFYMMILYWYPHVVQRAFKKEYDLIQWRNNEGEFEKWCQGNTGFPIVDAGMRELNATGFMHNRVRMIVSSFLVKDLLIDWRWGESYFAEKLNDFDLSANNGGWQWAAGSGCDAAPYFRIFNPYSQQQKFDPDFEYIKKWIPEFGTAKYPKAMVDHAAARLRALQVYKQAFEKQKQMKLF